LSAGGAAGRGAEFGRRAAAPWPLGQIHLDRVGQSLVVAVVEIGQARRSTADSMPGEVVSDSASV
jgi:hypothetical protein